VVEIKHKKYKNMKKGIIILLLSVFYINIYSQYTKKCNTAISNFEFQQKYNYINAKSSQQGKLVSAKKIALANCLSSTQVKKIAELFSDDFSRLDFVKKAYKNTVDKNNFYEVYNSFIYFSSVFRLHDYIKGVADNNNGQVGNINFPMYNYPSSDNYYGKKACNLNLNSETFYIKAIEINKQYNEASKMIKAQIITNSYCISCTQLMKFTSLLSSETNRLNILKSAYSHVYDLNNYNYTLQLLKNQKLKNDLTKFINSNLGNGNGNGSQTECKVSKSEFVNIKAQIKKQSFSNTKMNLTKQILISKKCFRTNQIIEIVNLFTFPKEKLKIAKFAYDYTKDKDNYFKVTNALSYEFDKQELLNYIKKRK